MAKRRPKKPSSYSTVICDVSNCCAQLETSANYIIYNVAKNHLFSYNDVIAITVYLHQQSPSPMEGTTAI